MHESLKSIRWSWIGFGWFIAVSLASLLLLALDAFGVLATDSAGETLWVAVSLVVGFFAVGAFVGTRVAAAPLLHGLGMGLFSLLAWFLVNLFLGEPTGQTTWRSLDPVTLSGLLLIQIVAAVVGTRIGVRWVRAGR